MTTAIDWDYLEKKTAELAEKSEGEERDALLVEMIGRQFSGLSRRSTSRKETVPWWNY